ncbi:MAG: ACP phosphodiesterase [Desulfuromonadaceae bacterium]|nr:ACP phosphodiesterase [Desulfuromonadaceae bacterium]MDD2847046.1 ACP phosphodiesterase [Desulfuromonadaceae bacterium]MDD4128976.1 ACP phosphodiesterase [Desulfuromonadaceae bacterium]
MNFLFHMLLSGDDDQLMVGNFMGDFVKGPLQERFSPTIRQGVALHRRIDSYAERHPLFRRSRQRISQDYGLYRGVMVDMFYDYYLVNAWDEWCDEPLGEFLIRTRTVVENNMSSLPTEMHRLVPVIFEELLPTYGTVEGIATALSRLSRRITRSNPLSGGEEELLLHHDTLRDDFRGFTPEVFRFAGEIITAFTPSTFTVEETF